MAGVGHMKNIFKDNEYLYQMEQGVWSGHVGVLRHSENISEFCASAEPGAHIY